MPFPDPEHYLKIGDKHYEMENYEGAIRSYEKILALTPFTSTLCSKWEKLTAS